jgi:hypothetical protein
MEIGGGRGEVRAGMHWLFVDGQYLNLKKKAPCFERDPEWTEYGHAMRLAWGKKRRKRSYNAFIRRRRHGLIRTTFAYHQPHRYLQIRVHSLSAKHKIETITSTSNMTSTSARQFQSTSTIFLISIITSRCDSGYPDSHSRTSSLEPAIPNLLRANQVNEAMMSTVLLRH